MSEVVQILEFSFANVRSFYKRQTLSFSDDGVNARSVTAIYGANASGKSNTAKALVSFKEYVRHSADPISFPIYSPFLLREGADKEDSEYELAFNYDDRIFVYTVRINIGLVMKEKLIEKSIKNKRSKVIFSRDSKMHLSSNASRYGFTKELAAKTRPDSLLITKSRENNNEYGNIVFDALDSIYVMLGNNPSLDSQATVLLNQHQDLMDDVVKLIQQSDFSIKNIKIEQSKFTEEMLEHLPFSEKFKAQIINTEAYILKFVHKIRNKDKKVIGEREFDLINQESLGTRRFFEIIVPTIYSLKNGKTLYIDEFGTDIHSYLVESIVHLYKNQDKNQDKNKAHLIVNSHQTNFMKLLDREDIILIEKNIAEESIITPLKNRSVRKNEPFEKRYLEGIYGGVPSLETILGAI